MTAEQVLTQFDYALKQLSLVHQENQTLFEYDEKLTGEEWIEEVYECVFTFKPNVYIWLREANTERSSIKTYSQKGFTSVSSRGNAKTK